MTKKEIGSRIRKIREGMKLGQRDFGKLAGVSNASISAYEVGNYYPTIDILARIAEVGKVSVAWLILGDRWIDSLDNMLSNEDKRLFKAFHEACTDDRETILRVAELAARRGNRNKEGG